MPRILYVSDCIFLPSRLTGQINFALSPLKSALLDMAYKEVFTAPYILLSGIECQLVRNHLSIVPALWPAPTRNRRIAMQLRPWSRLIGLGCLTVAMCSAASIGKAS